MLSIVVTSRNDDHGGGMLRRMQLFVTNVLTQSEQQNVPLELVLVDWNPPEDRPKLIEALQWPTESELWAVRAIEVPREVHRSFRYSDRLPLFQMIGKNVGIRRARAPFVLASNVDILFSDEMFDFFGSPLLRGGRMYRVDRYDVPAEIPDALSVGDQLDYCRDNIIRRHDRYGTAVADRPGAPLPATVRPGLRRRLKNWILRVDPPLHTNACGDFTLMAKEAWEELRGYPEFEMFSWKIDGLLCYAAHYAGTREHVLQDPARIYHIEHAAGSGWTPGSGEKLLDQRLSTAGIPRITGAEYAHWIEAMRTSRRPLIFNDNDAWGLAEHDLPETVVAWAKA